MRVQEMPRYQLEAIASRLGIRNPQHYNMPELRAAVKARYQRQKSGQAA